MHTGAHLQAQLTRSHPDPAVPPEYEGARKVCNAPSDTQCNLRVTASYDVPVIQSNDGHFYATCLDPYDADHIKLQRDLGLSIALTSLFTFILTFMAGYHGLSRVRRDFRRMQAVVDAEAKASAQRASGAPSHANASRGQGEAATVEMLSADSARAAVAATRA